jgi:hypothetical protein
LTKVVVKTLAAFLNSQGGSLIIGVDDHGNLLDLESDIATLGKKSIDGFELALRSAIANHLGAEIDAEIRVAFATIDGKRVAHALCGAHPTPVYFKDGDDRQFVVRSGNLSRSLNVAATVAYVANHWPPPAGGFDDKQLRAALAEVISERLPTLSSPTPDRPEQIPVWIRLATRRVLDLFLSNLSVAHDWKRLDIISPWISDIEGPLATLSSNQLVRRLQDDGTTMYVVTRPPEKDWHARAVDRLADSGRANIAYLPGLHVKLFAAQTAQASFAMLGSANFTARSLVNREIGVLVTSTGDGKPLVRDLSYEAAEIYRHPDRELVRKARL